MKYRQKIKYNQSGERFILNWFTYNEQSRLIVAKSKSAVIQTVNKIIKSPYYSSELEFRNFLKIELVSLSKRKISELENKFRQEDIKYFYESFLRHLWLLFRNDPKELPNKFQFCNCETYCDDCDGNHVTSSYSKEELYQLYSENYIKLFGKNSYYAPYCHAVDQIYLARQINDNETIYLADYLTKGRLQEPVPLEEDNIYTPTALFYFKIIEKLDLTEINSILDIQFKYQKEARKKYIDFNKKKESEKIISEQLKMLELLDSK